MDPAGFYDELAPYFHLIHPDWEKSVARQGEQLDTLIQEVVPGARTVHDAACGVGTQALGLAARGYKVTASDIASTAVERARRESTFKETIAHGYLSLSLVSHFLGECGVLPEGTVMAINYGSDKVRFLQPVAVNSKVRGHGKLLEVNEKSPGQYLVKTGISVEIEGQEKPALVAEILSMFIVQ